MTLTALATVAPGVAADPAPAATGRVGADTAAEWYDTTVRTIAVAGSPAQITNGRTWAVSWLAATRAVHDAPAGPDRRAFQDAALAGALHTSLTTLIPARTAELDAALRRTLDRVPDGAAERRGLAAGRRHATTVLSSREGDGLDPGSVEAPFTPPAPQPGVWRPTPPDHRPAAQAGSRHARPFLLARPDQFRLDPPPPLGSQRYRADLAEVREYGGATGSRRTPEQTETAEFWLGSPLALYNEPLRVALTRSVGQPLTSRTRLVALFHIALVDTQIATSDSKYAHLRWRPVTAIRSADLDGDPATAPDPHWTPLHPTPRHPDYPSGHTSHAAAAEAVLTALTGPRTRPFRMTSPTAPGLTRTYTSWHRLTRENVDARIWSGVHTRSADLAGVRLGGRVAAHALSRFPALLR
ncbi:vanadium-dependent haloperoxidase [Streptomyces sp. NPDC018031]|uniref:vanadium-dependent haloperoxidase n=1 Tax=Streptomyces sp. NPDC018031 TaxID=3365033 RepID=UPI0037AFB036